MKRSLLAGAIAAISFSAANAGEAVFYITEDGQAINNISVQVDGKKKLVGKNGFVAFELSGGNHQVELSQFGEWAGEFDFTASVKQNAEVQVDMLGGEAMPDVRVYTPGQETAVLLGRVRGYVESDETGGGVAGARISIKGSDKFTMSDANGEYELELPRGEYSLNIAHPNYGQSDVNNLRVLADVATQINTNLSLTGDGIIEEVVALGSYVPSTATAQERDSSAVLDAIGSEQFARFGDSSAASALKRVAGVSLVGGQYAVIRGLKGRYISSTLNGAGMPSTDPMRRDVPLDLFPSSVLGGIEIQKSYTPDLPGDTTGGAIRMATKGLPDEAIKKLSVGLGYNTQVTGKDVVSYDGSGSDYLGFDDGLRDVPSSVDKATNGGEQGSLGDYCIDGSCEFSPADLSGLLGDFENTYNVKNTTGTPNVNIAYSFGDRIEMGTKDFGFYGALEYKNKWSTREDAQIHSTSGDYNYERSKRNIDLTGYFVTGIEDEEGNEYLSRTTLLRKTDDTTRATIGVDSEEISVEEYTLQWVERQFLSQQFTGMQYVGENQQLDWRFGFSQTSRYEPDRRTYQFRQNVIAPSTLERRFSDMSENSFDLGVDHIVELSRNDWSTLKIKTGLLINSKDRDMDLVRYGVTNGPGDTPDSINLEEVLSDENLANNAYLLAVRTTPTDSYKASESMKAVYQSIELDINGEYIFLVGARLEDAEQEIKYADKPSANSKLATNEILPMLSGTWHATEELQFRAALSNTLARPGITELANSSTYDPETDQQLFGNPDLEISKITNLDLRIEYYLSDEESISLALFTKDIDKPIEKTLPDGSGSAQGGYTYENSKEAMITGFEIDFRKNILDGLDWTSFLSGNLAWIDSEVTLDEAAARLEGKSTRKLQGQSEILANMQVGFDHFSTGQSLTFLLNYFDDRLYAVTQGAALGNEFEKGRMLLDVVYRWDISDDLAIKGKATNLTNEVVEYSQNGVAIESYKEGTELSLGLDYIF
jgi:hypothetical protein